jgi:UDPglucose 6-dehydrogenase
LGLNVGICGDGWVGKSMQELFPDAVIYDEPMRRGNRTAIGECAVTFVCVPTPLLESGELDTSIVEDVVGWCESDLIVIRSTVNPGTTDRLKHETGKHIVFEPEYLGETPAHPLLHPNGRQFKVIGGAQADRRKLIDLYSTVYNSNTNIRQLTALEAEVVKLSENRAIGFKVMQMHELYEACEAAGLDYYVIRDAVYGDDPRFDLWFSFIYPGNLGFNSSKCLKKDIPAWCAWAESIGVKPEVTKKLVEKSNEYANA